VAISVILHPDAETEPFGPSPGGFRVARRKAKSKGGYATAGGVFVNVTHAAPVNDHARAVLRSVVLALAIGVLLGRLGPFGTFSDLAWSERYAYWIALTLLMWAQTALLLHALRTVPGFAGRPLIVQIVLVGLLAAIPTTFEVAWAEMLLRYQRGLGSWGLARLYGDVALVAIAAALPMELAGGHALLPRAARSPAEPNRMPDRAGGSVAIVERLPPDRRGRLLALSAEDHYLRIHTCGGDGLVLMRMGDALGQLASADGVRVHRSWWVARDAVVGVEREGDRIALRLENGLMVPVSRTYLLAVREAGLLD
jgi:hypothetical protein